MASVFPHAMQDVCLRIPAHRTVLEGELPGPRPDPSSGPRATRGPCSSALWRAGRGRPLTSPWAEAGQGLTAAGLCPAGSPFGHSGVIGARVPVSSPSSLRDLGPWSAGSPRALCPALAGPEVTKQADPEPGPARPSAHGPRRLRAARPPSGLAPQALGLLALQRPELCCEGPKTG